MARIAPSEMLLLAERLDAWSPLVSAGHEVPAAGTVMWEAARMLREIAREAAEKPTVQP